MTGFRCVLFCLGVASLPLASLAQQQQQQGQQQQNQPTEDPVFAESLVVTATGEEAPSQELPVTVSVIDRLEIETSQEETVVDLVRRVPGITVMQTGGRGGSAAFFVRGTESDHVLALFDGVRLNSPYFAGYDFSLLPSAGVERVEVARGPLTALWGSDAVGGVINVIPMRAQDNTQLQLTGELGESAWQRLEGTVSHAASGFDVFASYADREGEGELHNSDFSNRQGLLNAGFEFEEPTRVAVVYQDLKGELGVPFSNPITLTQNRRQSTQQELLALPMTFQLAPAWRLELVPSEVQRELQFEDPDDAFGFTRSDTLADSRQVRLASHHSLGERKQHALSFGGEWREDEVTATSNFGTNLDGDTSEVASLFAQDVWRFGERLTLIGGLRHDETDEWGSEVSPRLALGYQATEHVAVRASFGEAFRQPALGELYFPFSGNPRLEPERSESAEVGVAVRSGAYQLDAAVFATDTENMIDFDFASFTNVNIAEAQLRGAEMSLTKQARRGLRSQVSLTWLDTENQDGLPLLRRPEWSANASLSGELGPRLRGDLAFFYVGERVDADAVSFARKDVGGYVTGNLALSYELTDRLSLTARVLNLLDREYQEIDGYPAAPRRSLLGLRYRM